MTITSLTRIARDHLRDPRARYWSARQHLARVRRLLRAYNRDFRRHVARDHAAFLKGSVRPIRGEARERAFAAVDWLLRAQDATPDDGVSYGYFPCEDETGTGWKPSYPETTGYIVPSLLEFADRFGIESVRARALAMAAWEITVQMPSGAVQAGPIRVDSRPSPAVFNTGMVLHGYTAAYRATGEARFLEAGRRAADFLVNDQGADGHFRTHGPSVAAHRVKTYNCLCAWALHRFGEDAKETRYQDAALRAVEAAVRQQRPNGWFADNCLVDPEAPLTHTIGYTLQGILETAVLSDRADLLQAVRRGTDPLVRWVARRPLLHGQFYADWQPAVFSACLTGNAQLAIVCYRLYEATGDAAYRDAADALVDHLKPLQVLDSPNRALNGALAGSFPLFGAYMPAGYPNWATKYFLDALLLQHALGSR
jgi:hypothetical protein